MGLPWPRAFSDKKVRAFRLKEVSAVNHDKQCRASPQLQSSVMKAKTIRRPQSVHQRTDESLPAWLSQPRALTISIATRKMTRIARVAVATPIWCQTSRLMASMTLTVMKTRHRHKPRLRKRMYCGISVTW